MIDLFLLYKQYPIHLPDSIDTAHNLHGHVQSPDRGRAGVQNTQSSLQNSVEGE